MSLELFEQVTDEDGGYARIVESMAWEQYQS